MRLRPWFLLCSALCAAGCADGDHPRASPSLPPPTPLPECPASNYEACDIRAAACQKQLAELAACLRQSAPLDVSFELVTEEQSRALLEQDYAAQVDSRSRYAERALSVLGLAPKGDVSSSVPLEDRARTASGVYRAREKRVVIVDQGQPADSAATDALLVHELVHASQDADYDLLHWPDDARRSFDEALARSTVVEGEAELLGYRAAVALLGLDLATVDFESAFHLHLAKSLEQALSSDQPLAQSLSSLSYGMGALQAYSAWQHGGPRGLDSLWASPPRNMQRVMAELFGQGTPQDTGIEIEAPQLEGLTLRESDVLGAWGVYLMLARAIGAEPLSAALAWRGDRYRVYTDERDDTYALWQLELDSEQAARGLAAIIPRTSYIEREVHGPRLYISYGVDTPSSPALGAWGAAWLTERP